MSRTTSKFRNGRRGDEQDVITMIPFSLEGLRLHPLLFTTGMYLPEPMEFTFFPNELGVKNLVKAIKQRCGTVVKYDDTMDGNRDHLVTLINTSYLMQATNRRVNHLLLPNDAFDLSFIIDMIATDGKGVDLKDYRFTATEYEEYSPHDLLLRRINRRELRRLREPPQPQPWNKIIMKKMEDQNEDTTDSQTDSNDNGQPAPNSVEPASSQPVPAERTSGPVVAASLLPKVVLHRLRVNDSGHFKVPCPRLKVSAETTATAAPNRPKTPAETTTAAAPKRPKTPAETTTAAAPRRPNTPAETTTVAAPKRPKTPAETTTAAAPNRPKTPAETTTAATPKRPKTPAETTTAATPKRPKTPAAKPSSPASPKSKTPTQRLSQGASRVISPAPGPSTSTQISSVSASASGSFVVDSDINLESEESFMAGTPPPRQTLHTRTTSGIPMAIRRQKRALQYPGGLGRTEIPRPSSSSEDEREINGQQVRRPKGTAHSSPGREDSSRITRKPAPISTVQPPAAEIAGPSRKRKLDAASASGGTASKRRPDLDIHSEEVVGEMLRPVWDSSDSNHSGSGNESTTTTVRRLRERREYSREECQHILNVVVKYDLSQFVTGCRVWQLLLSSELLYPNKKPRTYQSLQTMFRNKIMPDLEKNEGRGFGLYRCTPEDFAKYQKGRKAASRQNVSCISDHEFKLRVSRAKRNK